MLVIKKQNQDFSFQKIEQFIGAEQPHRRVSQLRHHAVDVARRKAVAAIFEGILASTALLSSLVDDARLRTAVRRRYR